MAKLPPNAEYSYHLPTGGLFFRLRNVLSQFSDLFSEFNKYIAPAYHHDRCERSVPMRLYSMHKREFVMVLLAFFAFFGLGVFIGLAGPPITTTTEIDGANLASNQTAMRPDFLASGPFNLRTPYLTTYMQALWLIAKLRIDNTDNEIFDKSFQISMEIDGVTAEHHAKQILTRATAKNRTRHLICSRNDCQEFTVLHLGFLNYAHYIITVRFYDLESFHQRYNINAVKFYFKTYNPAFTQVEIWFRFIFLLTTFIVLCWYAHTLRKYPTIDWSIEQKWVAILLPLLLLYNNPLFPMTLLINSWLPGFLDAIFQATFLCAMMTFWLCIYHGLRQNERKFVKFYLPKLLVVGPIWLSAIVLATWEKINELKDPTYSHFVDIGFWNYNNFKIFFYASGVVYLIYLALLMLRAYSELRSMPYFDMRLKFLSLFMIFVLSITLTVTLGRFGFGVLEDNFVANLNTTYRSSAQFMCFYGLLNFYVATMAYVYSPDDRAEPRLITKDNPAFSMVNDSDSEVVYEDESRRPLNSGKGDDDSD